MLRPLITLVLSLAILAVPLRATWSIILIHTKTGEIAIGCATCITGFDLAAAVPVLVIDKGAGCAQSFVDQSGANRIFIRDQLALGTDPVQILAQLAQRDPQHQTRQYGIVDVRGRAVGFSGTSAGAYAGDRIGRVGDVAYAIQGNVLTGGAVLAAAELALYTTNGDLSEKLMAAMDAARAFGGDGRCSCSEGNPTGCGAPPASFTKSSHIAFMIIGRPGDTDGTCSSAGCANGSYYMRLNVANQPSTAPDPVVQLRGLYDTWKTQQRGRPDQVLSTITFDPPTLPRDGRTVTTATLVLRDREGTRITRGGANVGVALDPTSTSNATIGAVRDHGDGRYSFPITAGTNAAGIRLRVTVDDGSGPRRLTPAPGILVSTEFLWTDRAEISAAQGGRLAFAVQPGPPFGVNRIWVLLASNSGTSPGVTIPPFYHLKLNPDPLFQVTVIGAFHQTIPELIGVTSGLGLSTSGITFPPGLYGLRPGTDLAFAYVLINPVSLTSNPVTIRIVP
jgi:uncharacterized Ntn-hydrolase superfamily protein